MLGGGGFVASSWLTGLITGMAEAGVDVRDADLLLGTSSGARVALQLASAARSTAPAASSWSTP